MPTDQILTLLEAEKTRLDQAIALLKGGQTSKALKSKTTPNGSHARRGMSAAARKAQSKRMKAYWAKRRKNGAASAKKSS